MSAGSVDGLVIFLFYCICISKMGVGGGHFCMMASLSGQLLVHLVFVIKSAKFLNNSYLYL